MGDSVIQVGIPAIFGAGVIAYILLRIIFKKSIIFTVGVLFLICADLIAALAFFVGHSGLHNLYWHCSQYLQGKDCIRLQGRSKDSIDDDNGEQSRMVFLPW